MYVGFYDFGPDVPSKERYEQGVDYLLHEFDLGVEDALYLVTNLKNNHSRVDVSLPGTDLNFYVCDHKLYVQIDTPQGFWHGSNFDAATAREILKVASEGCQDFGEKIPGTDQVWDVY